MTSLPFWDPLILASIALSYDVGLLLMMLKMLCSTFSFGTAKLGAYNYNINHIVYWEGVFWTHTKCCLLCCLTLLSPLNISKQIVNTIFKKMCHLNIISALWSCLITGTGVMDIDIECFLPVYFCSWGGGELMPVS